MRVIVTDAISLGIYSVRGDRTYLSIEATPGLPADGMLQLSRDEWILTDVKAESHGRSR